jgi:prepilin-type N-terminal cleavage/methylation domain-containing protein/prepilin-type processing-associated H-X9-DG protein
MAKDRTKGFTLIEVLVVVSVISVLMAILMPALAAARSHARSAVCTSNLRQLVLANNGYATENDGFYVPAASDMWDSSGRHRWHGTRESLDEPFEPSKGPLVRYLGDGKVKRCPEMSEFVQGGEWESNFEQGCGGYGYNMTYLGSRLGQAGVGFRDSYEKSANVTEVARPGETVMFADCAMSKDGKNLIEYSFAEPPRAVYNGNVMTSFFMSPSVHFRHRGRAKVGWADGHVDLREMVKFEQDNAFGVNSAALGLGWFDVQDNSLFDLK